MGRLVCGRKPGQGIVMEVEGHVIRVMLVDAGRNGRRLAIDAPEDVTIWREEIYDKREQGE
jgi:carbon storage regulator CsrA